jgi:hypothetical protein
VCIKPLYDMGQKGAQRGPMTADPLSARVSREPIGEKGRIFQRPLEEEAAEEGTLVRGRSFCRKSNNESSGKCVPWKAQYADLT